MKRSVLWGFFAVAFGLLSGCEATQGEELLPEAQDGIAGVVCARVAIIAGQRVRARRAGTGLAGVLLSAQVSVVTRGVIVRVHAPRRGVAGVRGA